MAHPGQLSWFNCSAGAARSEGGAGLILGAELGRFLGSQQPTGMDLGVNG